jgi:hypothetical protein
VAPSGGYDRPNEATMQNITAPKIATHPRDAHGRGLSKPCRRALNHSLPPRIVAENQRAANRHDS